MPCPLAKNGRAVNALILPPTAGVILYENAGQTDEDWMRMRVAAFPKGWKWLFTAG